MKRTLVGLALISVTVQAGDFSFDHLEKMQERLKFWASGQVAEKLPSDDKKQLDILLDSVNALDPSFIWRDRVVKQFEHTANVISGKVKGADRSLRGFLSRVDKKDRLTWLKESLAYLDDQLEIFSQRISENILTPKAGATLERTSALHTKVNTVIPSFKQQLQNLKEQIETKIRQLAS